MLIRMIVATLVVAAAAEPPPAAPSARSVTLDEVLPYRNKSPKLERTPASPPAASSSSKIDFPIYDVEALCAGWASERCKSQGAQCKPEITKNLCIAEEQTAYDTLWLLWDGASDKTLSFCSNRAVSLKASERPNAYQIWSSCVSLLRDRDEGERPRKFRY